MGYRSLAWEWAFGDVLHTGSPLVRLVAFKPIYWPPLVLRPKWNFPYSFINRFDFVYFGRFYVDIYVLGVNFSYPCCLWFLWWNWWDFLNLLGDLSNGFLDISRICWVICGFYLIMELDLCSFIEYGWVMMRVNNSWPTWVRFGNDVGKLHLSHVGSVRQ